MMEVILSHEQADFDAFASMLGAKLLNPQAIAILPRAMNRNVQAYLQKYFHLLPFDYYENLPHRPIDHITLVDTQSMVTLRGFTKTTQVAIIDHHTLKPELDPQWVVEIQRSGACTTMLVEKIIQAQVEIGTLEATTLLLGIYEDTGSLSYTATTPQDMRAAAFLLEKGADLAIVSEYLYPPLTAMQNKLYDRLLADMQSFEIHGQTVLAAYAMAEDVKDEISSVAHKLRDFLEPQMMLLLVFTRQGIRLVARATSDGADVARIAAHFGGGGHKRAASALIRADRHLSQAEKETQLKQVFDEMIAMLPEQVKPLITVRQIMSKKPLLLSPDMAAKDAAQLMQRYSFEGYPVVADGKILGLLNRRSVERALAHELDVSVASLMDAGNIYIFPDDSLQKLQEVMSRTRWGQIPVVDPQSGNILGIVTRTDLIKTLGEASDLPRRSDIITRLGQAVPPARLALIKAIAKQAHDAIVPVFIVGGFVRDLLLERPSLDFDIVVEGNAIDFAHALVQTLGGELITHRRFGTAKWTILHDQARIMAAIAPEANLPLDDLPAHLDLISARTEFYEHPAALPTVENASIKMDLHRRDFTINTLALRLDGEHYGQIHDYWGGFIDLQKGLIRVLHTLSFVDDATRMLRAVRFEQRFGFAIEERTLNLIHASLSLLQRLSGTRLQHELNLILSEGNAAAMLNRMYTLEIMQSIHPDLAWTEEIGSELANLPQQPVDACWEIRQVGTLTLQQRIGWCLWLRTLPLHALESVADRLRFPNELLATLRDLITLQQDLPPLLSTQPSPSALTARLDQTCRLALYVFHLSSKNPAMQQAIMQYLTTWQKIQPYTNGHDLKAAGMQPSPEIGSLLWQLRKAWLDGEIKTAAEEKSLLTKLISTRN